MPAARDHVTIAELTMGDYPVVHVLWQRGDLWLRPSDGPEATLLKLTRPPSCSWSSATPAGVSSAR